MATKEKQYTEAVGRRKRAVARVRITPAKDNAVTVNDQTLETYFPLSDLQKTVMEPLRAEEGIETFTVTVKVAGGGMSAQAEAVRHGIARALVVTDPDLRSKLKKAGYLKRDPRKKERKKFGLRKARRAPQWSKR